MTSTAGASFAQAYAPPSAGMAEPSPRAAGDELRDTLQQELEELLARRDGLDERIARKSRQLQLLDTATVAMPRDRPVEPVDAEDDVPPGTPKRRHLHPRTPIEQRG